jgi:hypothetical protein
MGFAGISRTVSMGWKVLVDRAGDGDGSKEFEREG